MYVGHWPTFHGPVILTYILKTFWWRMLDWRYWFSVTLSLTYKYIYVSQWPIFCGTVILPYIFNTISLDIGSDMGRWPFLYAFRWNIEISQWKQTVKITVKILFFHCLYKTGFLWILCLKSCPKGLKCSILVSNYDEDVNVSRWNRWHHLLHWRNAFSAHDVRWTIVTDCSMFLNRFLAFYCFKRYFGSFSRYKTVFLPTTIPLKHDEQD